MSELYLSLLGPLQVTRNASRLTTIRAQKEQALLAYLAEDAEHLHQRSVLIGLFWPELPERSALNNLSQTLGRIRRRLESANSPKVDYFVATRKEIQFVPSDEVVVDTTLFTKTLCEKSAAGSARSGLETALQYYRGDFLEGLSLPGCEEFEMWLLFKREHYRRLAMEAMTRLANLYLDASHYADAQAVAHRHLTLEPWAESAHRQLMRALALDGQRTAALAQYEKCRTRLLLDLGIEPDAITTTLFQQIQHDELDTGATVDSASIDSASIDSASIDSASIDSALVQEPSLPATPTPSLTHDWHEMPTLPNFFGRSTELAQLQQWLVGDRCALVAILGIGGQGKTTLAAELVPTIADQFDLVIWRSLLNAPPLAELLGTILPTLSGQPGIQLPPALDQQLALFFSCLQQRRIMLVLDNLESILQADAAGQYRSGYESYHQLLQGVATHRHQGQLLITGRERPQSVGRWELDTPLVRTLRLSGLDEIAGHQLLSSRGVVEDHGAPTSRTDAAALVQRYSGNPLALKLVTQTVYELFGGDTAAFLATETAFFDDIGAVLDQQFSRLSAVEQEILFWFAIERRPVTAATLRSNLVQPPTMARFITALRFLQRRSLLEKVGDGFTLQNVVIEYLTDRLVEGIYQDITQDSAMHAEPVRTPRDRSLARSFLNRFALFKAQTAAYIQQSQKRLILYPLTERLLTQFGQAQLAGQIEHLLTMLRQEQPHQQPLAGYAGGNLLNLIIELGLPASDYDFHSVSVWQADLRGVYLPGLQLAGADLTGAAFTHTFRNIKAMRYHSDGKLLVVGHEGDLFGLWNARNGELVQRLKVDPHKFVKAFLRRDCRLIAQYNIDHSIDLVAVSGGQIIQRLYGASDLIWRMSFSPNGQYTASGDRRGTVCIWRIADGQLLRQWQAQADAVTGLAFAPDSEHIATGGLDGVVNLWQATSATLIRTFHGHTDEVSVLDFTPDSTRLITGSHDYTVRVWGTADGALISILQGHTNLVRELAIDPTGRWVATGGLDSFISLWEIESGQAYHVLTDHASRSSHITFSPDGQTVAACDTNENINVWSVASGYRLQSYQLHFAELTSVAFSPDGRWLAVGSADWAIYLCDVQQPAEPQIIARLPGHRGILSTIAFSPDSSILASGDKSGDIHLWRGHQWKSQVLPKATGEGSIALSPNGEFLASADDEGLRLWSVVDGRQLEQLRSAATGARTCAFSPDGRWIVSSHRDHTLCLWEVDTFGGSCLQQTLQHHTNIVNNVLFSPDGRYLFSSSFDGTLCRWDAHTGEHQASWQTVGTYHALAIHPDGHCLAAGSTNQVARLIDVESGSVINELHGHTRQIEALSFSADGQLLATASFDATIRLWEVSSGRCLQTLRIPGPYAGMNIAGVTGISDAQKAALKALGAVET